MNTTIKLPAGHELICIGGKGSHSIWRAVHTAGCGLRSSGDHRGYRVGQQKCKAQANEHTCPATKAPAPLDIPAAIRAYIEAEWRGASHAALSAKRGEITAALLAADPELSNTAATFRFHKLVAEMRDNDSIGADLLAQMTPAAPQVVTVDGPEGSGLRWHLVDADSNPVTAGEHRALWSGQPRFTIAERPEVQSWDGEVPLNIWIMWVGDTRGYCRADQLVDGWSWELEVTAA